MKISVIVPVYRVEPWLDRCIMSLLSQTFAEFEILLVDDGSPDRCGEMCDDWAKRDSRIRVHHKPNGGLSSARNCGLDLSCGEYVTFVDSDDYVKPGFLSDLASLIESSPEVDYAETAMVVVRSGRESPRDESGRREVLSPVEAMRRMLYDEGLFTSACGKLFRRDFISRFRFPDGRLYEEILLAAEYVPAARKIAYGGIPGYVYSIRRASITTAMFRVENLRQHLLAARALAAAARRLDPSLDAAALRFETFSRLRTLRFMRRVRSEKAALAGALRSGALETAPKLLADPRVPRRDKVALRLLRLGLWAYWLGWLIYVRVRR